MPEKLRIGFDAKRAFQNKAGLGNYSRNIINSICEIFPDNDYFLFTPQTDESVFFPPRISTAITPQKTTLGISKAYWRTYKIAELAKHENLDIYHGLSHELPVGIKKTGIKSVVTIHDLIFMRFPEFYKPTDRIIYQKKYKTACKIADKIIAISQQTKDDLIDLLHVEEEKIELVYQSIKPVFFVKNAEEEIELTRNFFNLPTEFVLVPGTIEARKNLKNILLAFSEKDIKLPLVVVGRSTDYLEQLKSLLEKMQDQVIILNHVNDQQLAHLYQMASMTVYVSIFEGFGLPVAEAQACGCPVITSNVSSMPEAGGNAAMYVNPNEPKEIASAIIKLSADTELRNKMIEPGIKNAGRFRPEVQAKQLMNIYQNL